MVRGRRKPNSYIQLTTSCGEIKGLRQEGCLVFEGVKYAEAGRWDCLLYTSDAADDS